MKNKDIKTIKYKIKDFPSQDLKDIFYDEEVDGYKLIKKQINETTRWGVNETMYFRHNNIVYSLSVNYEVGDDGAGPFEYTEDTMECYEQIEKQILVTQYEMVVQDE